MLKFKCDRQNNFAAFVLSLRAGSLYKGSDWSKWAYL